MIKSGVFQLFFGLLLAMIQLLMLRMLHLNLSGLELGFYSLSMMLVFLLQSFCDMGISSYSINANNDNNAFNINLHKLSFYIGCLALFLGITLSYALASYYNVPEFFGSGFLLSFSFPFLTLSGFYQSILIRKGSLVLITAVDFITRGISVLLMLLLFHYHFGFNSFIYSYILYAVLRWGIYLVAANKRISICFRDKECEGPEPKSNEVNIKNFLNFTFYQFMSQFTNSISVKIDEFIIGRVMGLESLGIYTLIKNYVIQIGYLIMPIIRRLTLNLMSSHSKNGLLFDLLFKFFSYLTISYFIIVALFSKTALAIVFGQEMLKNIDIFIILLMVWAVRVCAGSVLSSAFIIKGKPNYDFYWNLAQGGIIAIVCCLSNSLLLTDLVLYIFISYVVYALIAVPLFCKLIKVNVSNIFINILVICFIASVIVAESDKLVDMSLIASFISVTIYCGMGLFILLKISRRIMLLIK